MSAFDGYVIKFYYDITPFVNNRDLSQRMMSIVEQLWYFPGDIWAIELENAHLNFGHKHKPIFQLVFISKPNFDSENPPKNFPPLNKIIRHPKLFPGNSKDF